MINTNINTKEEGVSEYTDIYGKKYPVKYSVVLTDTEKQELEYKIADDLQQIFAKARPDRQ